MRVYHGSWTPVREIDLSHSQFRKDFGRGFYLTNQREQADLWASKIGRRHRCEGVVSEFEFKEYVINDMQLKYKHFDSYSEEWLDFIILNRGNETTNQLHDYDIIEGNVANDDVAARIFDYQSGLVSKNDFLEELKFGSPNHQICFCTTQSLQALIPISSEFDSKAIFIDNEIIKSLIINFEKSEAEAMDIYYKSETFNNLSDISSKLYEKDWKEIFALLLEEIKDNIR